MNVPYLHHEEGIEDFKSHCPKIQTLSKLGDHSLYCIKGQDRRTSREARREALHSLHLSLTHLPIFINAVKPC